MIKSIALKKGMSDSDVATFTYVVNADKILHKFVVGLKDAVINGVAVTLEAAPYLDNGKIYVSVGDVAKAIGAIAYWNGNAITFSKKGRSLTLTVGDGNCFNANDLTMVNVMSVLERLSVSNEVEKLNISVTVKKNSHGDVNGDGKIDRKDLLRIAKYIAKWNVEVDKSGADVNGDGNIDRKDFLRLAKYIAKWDVTLGG